MLLEQGCFWSKVATGAFHTSPLVLDQCYLEQGCCWSRVASGARKLFKVVPLMLWEPSVLKSMCVATGTFFSEVSAGRVFPETLPSGAKRP